MKSAAVTANMSTRRVKRLVKGRPRAVIDRGPNVVNVDKYSRAVGLRDGGCRPANCLARGITCLTLEAASSYIGLHIYPPIEAYQNFKCSCDSEVTRGIGVACVHSLRTAKSGT